MRSGLAKWDPGASHSSVSHTEHREADRNPPALAVSYFQSLLSSPQAPEPGLRWGDVGVKAFISTHAQMSEQDSA